MDRAREKKSSRAAVTTTKREKRTAIIGGQSSLSCSECISWMGLATLPLLMIKWDPIQTGLLGWTLNHFHMHLPQCENQKMIGLSWHVRMKSFCFNKAVKPMNRKHNWKKSLFCITACFSQIKEMKIRDKKILKKHWDMPRRYGSDIWIFN